MANMTAEPFPPADDVDAPLTEAEIRAFVGRRADYYVDRWTRPGGKGPNWAAFFFFGFWMPYRKMYNGTFILYAVGIAHALVDEAFLFSNQLSGITSIVAAIICCSWANVWYFNHATSKIRSVRAQGLPEDEHLRAVASAGGTNVFAAIVLLVGAVVVAIVSTVLFDSLLGRAPDPRRFD